MNRPPATLVLASRSPQRRAILETLGVPFLARPADILERECGEPAEVALENALDKARAVARALPGTVSGPRPRPRPRPRLRSGLGLAAQQGRVVLGVDTLVALDGQIYGKPGNAAAAANTLRALSGKRHAVLSGLGLLGLGAEPQRGLAVTAVVFRHLERATIDWYLRSGEWRGRAGGYAIQGRGMALVEKIEGDYTNVVGLPVATLLGLWPQMLDQAT